MVDKHMKYLYNTQGDVSKEIFKHSSQMLVCYICTITRPYGQFTIQGKQNPNHNRESDWSQSHH